MPVLEREIWRGRKRERSGKKKVRRGMNITEAIKERGKRRMRKKGQETENGGKKEECNGRKRKENEK